ncbi:hypothetical protein UO65_0208 [Actinokineospora spheciospongiae]|uniref:Amidohydrolase-related domain-containing protein n=1 Tax=Actinokineospora spheciospongiae TaxID=909613 RepID=W7J6H8_9PSEU|nr:amidohydrolase family protein [Actinokineospora spheciospongiae]EWC64601.1 hypothetical protein UO65_0208 [Actinokineospora spheciospongiae]
MIDDIFVIDATVHPYNLSDANLMRGEDGQPTIPAYFLREMLWALHWRWAEPAAKLPREVFVTDWQAETLAWTMFGESHTDLAVNHRLRIDSVFNDGLCSHEKNLELAQRWPQRFINYAGVNPTVPVAEAIADLRRQVEEIPGTIGVKVYPNAGSPDNTWQMDSPEWEPFFALLPELGIKVVALHKVVANGMVPLKPFGIDDLEVVAVRHPELMFEIVHAGLPPFVEEVSMALMRLPNVFANLEITSALLQSGMGYIEDAVAQFIALGSPWKVIYSTGAMHFHPEPIVQAFANLTFSDRVLERYGIEQITKADKKLIMGENYARMIGLDIEKAKAAIAGDEFATAVEDNGVGEPWSFWRKNDPVWDGVQG